MQSWIAASTRKLGPAPSLIPNALSEKSRAVLNFWSSDCTTLISNK